MQRITNVQMLRAAAALVVAFGHAQFEALFQGLKLGVGFERSYALPWGSGVDLFFVISGFIMVYASERLFGRDGAGPDFLGRRLARIVPLYWLMFAIYLGQIALAVLAGTKAFPALVDILASFAFWPTDAFHDGVPRPIFTLGWTLNYEMFFYVVFALFVGRSRSAAFLGTGAVLAVLVGLGAALSPTAPALFFWTRPIVLEFVLGMGVAMLLRGGVSLTPALRITMALAGLAILVMDPMRSSEQGLDWITPNDVGRLLGWGVPAALIVAAAVLGPQASSSGLARAGIALGDASYALYLTHPAVIFGFRRLWLGAGLHERIGLWPMVIATMVSSCVVALLVHRFVETPMTTYVQARLRRRTFTEVASA